MREILFRGKHVSSGKWIISPSIRQEEDGSVYLLVKRTWYNVDPETVGQSTGLTDKSITRIFEGDIIRCKYANALINEHIQTVVFYNGKFMAKFSNGGAYAELFDGARHFTFDKSIYMTEVEVIGNIHDNPKLLEVEE
ncbi:MAG: YopX family protein [Clostridium sp.]|nr:YopX family protein [Clostridium sp.]